MRRNPFRLLADSDRACGVVAATTAIFLYISAANLPFGSVSAPDAGFFPKSLSAILAVLGLGLIFQPRPIPREPMDFNLRSWAVPVAALTLLAYAALLDRIGFVLSTTAVLFLLMTAYGRLRWIVALAVSASAVTVCYVGFTELGVPLPQGILSIF